MRIVLVRHGKAQQSGPHADVDRPLLPEGEAELEQSALAFGRLELRPSLVLTSPALRCTRSAQILAASLGEPPIRREDSLGGDGSVSKLFGVLAGLGDPAEILLVGHEPGLESLASVLLAGTTMVQLRFRCGSAACLEVDGIPPHGPAKLHWFLTPAQLRLMVEPARPSRPHETAK